MEIVFQYKYGTIYRDVLHVKRFDWCDAMNRRSAQNLVTKFIVDLAEENVPAMIHRCPYNQIIVDKVSMKTVSVGSIFPSVDYKFLAYLRDSNDDLLGTALLIASFNSTIKENFG